MGLPFKRQIESSRFCVLLDTSCVLDRACSSEMGGSRALTLLPSLPCVRYTLTKLYLNMSGLVGGRGPCLQLLQTMSTVTTCDEHAINQSSGG